jgi:hypothetical protein
MEDVLGLVEAVGADNVVFGSDYPHPEGMFDPVTWIDELETLPEADQWAIMGGNLARLMPREAMRRILRVQADSFEPRQDDSEHSGFQRGFALIILQGQLVGELPQTVTPASLGAMFEGMFYESLREWAYDEQADLLAMLRERFAVLLDGARAVTAEAIAVAKASGTA